MTPAFSTSRRTWQRVSPSCFRSRKSGTFCARFSAAGFCIGFSIPVAGNRKCNLAWDRAIDKETGPGALVSGAEFDPMRHRPRHNVFVHGA